MRHVQADVERRFAFLAVAVFLFVGGFDLLLFDLGFAAFPGFGVGVESLLAGVFAEYLVGFRLHRICFALSLGFFAPQVINPLLFCHARQLDFLDARGFGHLADGECVFFVGVFEFALCAVHRILRPHFLFDVGLPRLSLQFFRRLFLDADRLLFLFWLWRADLGKAFFHGLAFVQILR